MLLAASLLCLMVAFTDGPQPARAAPPVAAAPVAGTATGAATPTTGAAAANAPSALSVKVLAERIEAALAARSAILAQRRTLTERLAPIDKDLQVQAVERQAFTMPTTPDTAVQPTTPAGVQDLIDGLTAVAKALEQRMALSGNQETLANQHRETVLLLAQEVETLAQSQRSVQPLLDELAQRLSSDKLKKEELPEGLRTLPELDDLGALTAAAADWRAAGERDQVMIRTAKDERAQLESELATVQSKASRAGVWLTEANQRAALREEFTARSVADLVSLFNVRLAEVDDKSAALAERLATLSASQTKLNEAQTALDALKPNEAESTDQAGAVPEGLRRAHAALAAAEAAKAFQTERLEKIGEITKGATAQAEALAADLAAAEKLLAERIALEVMAEVVSTPASPPEASTLEAAPVPDTAPTLGVAPPATTPPAQPDMELPTAVTDGSLPEATRKLRAQVTELKAAQTAMATRSAALVKAREDAEKALAEAEKSLEDQTRAVEQEERWASFIADVESLPADQLGETFQTAVTNVETNEKLMAEAAAAAGETGAAIDEAAKALESHHDPVALAMSSNKDAFLEWRKTRDLVIAEKAAPVAAPAQTTDGAAPTASGGVNAAADTTASTDSAPATTGAEAKPTAAAPKPPLPVENWLKATRDLRDQTVARSLTYQKEEVELRTSFATALANHELKLGEEIQATEAALEAARRAWGAASTLRLRLAEGALNDPALAEAIKPWLERSRVTTLQDKVAALRAAQANATKQREALTNTQTQEALVAPLEAWADLLTTTAEALTEDIALGRQFVQFESIDKLDELERRMLEREIRRRISQDQGVYHDLGAYFGSQETGTIDELLSRYYTRLVVLERRIGNIEKRQEHLNKVIELTEHQREVMGELKLVLDKVAAEKGVQLDVSGTRVQAALFPAKVAELLAALKERTGVEVAPNSLPKLTMPTAAVVSSDAAKGGAVAAANGATNGAEDADDARRKLVNGLREVWAAAMGYQAWNMQVAANIQPLGAIDTRLGQYRSRIAELETAKEELRRTVHRLNGYAPSEMRGLVAGDQSLNDGAALGEIGLLQRERQELLQSRFLESIISLVIIPIGALILIFISGRFGRRMFLRPTRATNGEAVLDAAQQREREARARTLFGIFHKTVSTIIILLAIVYMLKVVNIDVTPIIASFGVFGLAVAFGAQAIMRDVFAGFFLLLENQLNRGDWVTINGLMGEVENIGLRLTTVRDFMDGQLHFIPNGQIRVVSNYNKEWSRVSIIIEVPFTVDSDMVVGVLKRVAAEMMDDPAVPNLKGGGAKGGVASLNHKNGTQGFMVQLDVLEADFSIGREYRRRAKMAFEALGIPLGMPHQVVRYLPDDGEWNEDTVQTRALT